MESRCHLGKSIVYDTVSNLSWSVDIRMHTIVNVIEKLLADPWPPAVDQGREVPEAVAEEDCVVSIGIPVTRYERLTACPRSAIAGTLGIIHWTSRVHLLAVDGFLGYSEFMGYTTASE